MRAVDLIRQKRDGGALTPEEIGVFVGGVTDGSWPDYQVSSMLMAITVRGMSRDETAALTAAMVASGRTLVLRHVGGTPVDKHSTGGVGDKTSLVLAPLAAACGAVVPMMSGRGLGHTGGTLDKLDTIPGFRTSLTLTEAQQVLEKTGCALFGQTAEIAPADRRLYALRDVTATVESIPLITASILSKKLAEGIGALVLDVKVGSGAFMKRTEDARRLAESLIDVAAAHGVIAEALLTPMSAPTGREVGNATEVAEAIATLRGDGPDDLQALSVRLAATMLRLAGICETDEDAERRIRTALHSGAGLERLREIIAAQGGDASVVDHPSRLPSSRFEHVVLAREDGVVAELDAWHIGRAAVALGAGRATLDDTIAPGAGIRVEAPVGTVVRHGDAVLRLRYDDAARLAPARELAEAAVVLGDVAPPPAPMVLDVVRRAHAAS